MAWDKSKPAGSQKIRLSDEEIRDNWSALEDWTGVDHQGIEEGSDVGKHNVIQLLDQEADPAEPSAGVIVLANNGDDFKIRVNGGSARYLDAIPSGEIILFEKDTVVTGYTLKTDKDDYLAFITKGSAAGGETGGGDHSTGTWTQPDHTLTEAEMPSHTHNIKTRDQGASAGHNVPSTLAEGYDSSPSATVDTMMIATGSGDAHNHGTTWRPKARCFTRQERN